MSLMANMTMMVLDLGSPPIRDFLYFLNYPLNVLVDCHVMESLNPFVVSVKYFPFPAQKLF